MTSNIAERREQREERREKRSSEGLACDRGGHVCVVGGAGGPEVGVPELGEGWSELECGMERRGLWGR